jgi:hypothetical protein
MLERPSLGASPQLLHALPFFVLGEGGILERQTHWPERDLDALRNGRKRRLTWLEVRTAWRYDV